MKNQQIHQQEKKITDLEKVVGSNKLAQTTTPENNTHTHTDRHTCRMCPRLHVSVNVLMVRFKRRPSCL